MNQAAGNPSRVMKAIARSDSQEAVIAVRPVHQNGRNVSPADQVGGFLDAVSVPVASQHDRDLSLGRAVVVDQHLPDGGQPGVPAQVDGGSRQQ